MKTITTDKQLDKFINDAEFDIVIKRNEIYRDGEIIAIVDIQAIKLNRIKS